jgi:hypothetical protein
MRRRWSREATAGRFQNSWTISTKAKIATNAKTSEASKSIGLRRMARSFRWMTGRNLAAKKSAIMAAFGRYRDAAARAGRRLAPASRAKSVWALGF